MLINDNFCRSRHQDGISIRCGSGHSGRAYGATGTSTVIDDDWLLPFLCELLANDARDGVYASACEVGHDEVDALLGPFLCECQQRGADCGNGESG
jgi:hypothetical protein